MSDTMQQPTGTGSLNDPEPAPVKNDNPEVWPMIISELTFRERSSGTVEGLVINAIIKDAQGRHQQGVQKYGVGLQPFNGRDALKDAYQEALDMLAYTSQLAWEHACDDNPDVFIEMKNVAFDTVLFYRAVIHSRYGK